MKISKKLALANVVMALSAIVVAGALSYTVMSFDRKFLELNDRTLQMVDMLHDMRLAGMRIVSSTRDRLLLAESIAGPADGRDAAATESAAAQRYRAELDILIERYRELVVVHFPDELELLQGIEGTRTDLLRQSRELAQSDLAADGGHELNAALQRFIQAEHRFIAAINAALAHESTEFDEKFELLHEEVHQTNTAIWLGLAAVAIFVWTVGSGVGRSIGEPLHRLTDNIEKVKRDKHLSPAAARDDDEIERLSQALEQMVERLEYDERLQAEFVTQLERKNAELERFTYTVSHDLKSPLVSVRGFLGMLEKDIAAADAAAIAKDFEYLDSAISSMGELLEDLLELSHAGRIINPPALFQMADLCREVVAALDGPARQHGVDISIAPDLPEAFGDRTRIREVLQNLVENAIKFSDPRRAAKIRLYAEQRDGRVVFVVEDNGIGIEPQFLHRIFGLFERLDAGADGSGIGLALVRRIVETHGGNVWAEAGENGQGTKFCFTLAQGSGEAIPAAEPT